MAKAVAVANGWEYSTHSEFTVVLNNVWKLTENDRVRELRSIANELHGYFYQRDEFLDSDAVSADIESVAELVELLAPLTQ